jgi:hypothetical protein
MMKTLATCAILLLVALTGAQAADDNGGTILGTFSNADGTSMLGVMEIGPTADDPQKGAALGIKYEHSDENYRFDGTYLVLTATFVSNGEWQKFVAIWEKARAAQGTTDAGDYFADGTLLSVSMESDGDISLTMAANPNANNVPQDIYVFSLQRKDFAAFDESVKKVSAYFAQ